MKKNFYISFIACLLLSFFTTAQGLIIPAGAYVHAGNGNIVVKNNWVNNGSFTHTGGAVIFNGTTQSLGGSSPTTFNNISVSTGSTTTINTAGHQVAGVIVSNGTFNANGNLTLLSTAVKTAAIDGAGTGEVTGNLTIQRYIASGFGYKYVSSPFQNDTVGDFANDMNLSASFPAFYKHDENLASAGWINYTSGAGALTPMHGYAANLGAATPAKTIDLKGVVNNHNISRTLYNHNMTYTQGFNLVGNPYPSPISWDAPGGWTKTNIDNAVYYFNAGTTNQYTGVYSSYINGVSSDGIAGSTIPAMQGFFVHVSNGTFPVAGQLIVTNAARILNPSVSFFRMYNQQRTQPLLRLSAGFDTEKISDAVTFYFSGDAGEKFNKTMDALKLMNTDTLVPNLYAVTTDAQKLSIQALPETVDSLTVVPLALSIKKDGWINFIAKDMQDIPVGMYIYLTDLVTGINHNCRKDSLYRLQLAAGVYDNRFFLKFSKKELADVNTTPPADDLKWYCSGNRLFVNAGLPAGEKENLLVLNMLGQVITRQEIAGNTYVAVNTGFTSGMYVIHVAGSTKKLSKKIFIGNR